MVDLSFADIDNPNDIVGASSSPTHPFSPSSPFTPSNLFSSTFDPDPDPDLIYDFDNSNINLGACSITDYNSRIEDSENQLIVMQTNCRSLCKNFDKLSNLVINLNVKPKIISLSETWIKSDVIDLYTIFGYKLFLAPRLRGRGGGVGVYVSNEFKTEICYEILVDKSIFSFELLITKTTINSQKTLYVLNLYRPPANSLKNLNNELSVLLSDLQSKHPMAAFLF